MMNGEFKLEELDEETLNSGAEGYVDQKSFHTVHQPKDSSTNALACDPYFVIV
jgi:hypothetical protein